MWAVTIKAAERANIRSVYISEYLLNGWTYQEKKLKIKQKKTSHAFQWKIWSNNWVQVETSLKLIYVVLSCNEVEKKTGSSVQLLTNGAVLYYYAKQAQKETW